MSLIPRSPSPGDRLDWRPREPQHPAPPLAVVPDSVELDVRSDLAHHRHDGIVRALGHLRRGIEEGRTPAYRRERALIELRASVQRQALVAGLGHLHVGTRPCTVMCEPMETRR